MAKTPLDKKVKNIYDRLYRAGIRVTTTVIKDAIIEYFGHIPHDISAKDLDLFTNMFQSPNGTDNGEAGEMITSESGKATLHNENDENVDAGMLSLLDQKMGKIAPASPQSSSVTQYQANQIVTQVAGRLNLGLDQDTIKSYALQIYEYGQDLNDSMDYAIGLLNMLVEKQEKNYITHLGNLTNDFVARTNESIARQHEVTQQVLNRVGDDLGASQNAYKSSCKQFKDDLNNYFTAKYFNQE